MFIRQDDQDLRDRGRDTAIDRDIKGVSTKTTAPSIYILLSIVGMFLRPIDDNAYAYLRRASPHSIPSPYTIHISHDLIAACFLLALSLAR